MKKSIFIYAALLSCILSGCTTYKASMSQASNNPLPEKLPKMTLDWTDLGNNKGSNPDFIKTIVQNEINKNVLEKESGSRPIGRVEVDLDKFNISQGWGMYVTSAITLFWMNILGVPLLIPKTEVGLTFKIYDNNDNLLKSYSYTEKRKNALGFYYGKDASVLACEATKSILEQFKRELTPDVSKVTAQLYNRNDIEQSTVKTPRYARNKSTKSSAATPVTQSDVDSNIPQAKSVASNTFALIIANEDYQFVDPVKFASHDGEVFKEYCIKTLGIPEKQVRYCANASYGIISGGVDWLCYALNNFENSRAIVYYCGHGIPNEKTGDAYIIPVDGKGTNTATCYSLNKLYKTLADTKASNITYFMDACFTGANKEGSMLVAARGVAREAKEETLDGNTIVFSASSGDETAMTYEEKGHGLFTYYLLRKLQQTSGNVTYSELAFYIRQNVKKEAFLINEKPQTPVVATSPDAASTWKTMKLK